LDLDFPLLPKRRNNLVDVLVPYRSPQSPRHHTSGRSSPATSAPFRHQPKGEGDQTHNEDQKHCNEHDASVRSPEGVTKSGKSYGGHINGQGLLVYQDR
jgi:hypothetical protein